MDRETKITEILIIIFLIIVFISPIFAAMLLIDNSIKSKHIRQLEVELNNLRFEADYLDFVKEDNQKQGY